MAENYPFDFDKLCKGTSFTGEELSRIVNEKIGTDAYSFQVMELKQTIERELASRGLLVTIKHEGYGLRILTDAEATEYNSKRFYSGLKTMKRSHVRALAVDMEQLTDQQQKDHDRRIEVQSKIIQGANNGGAGLKITEHVRVTPLLHEKTPPGPLNPEVPGGV